MHIKDSLCQTGQMQESEKKAPKTHSQELWVLSSGETTFYESIWIRCYYALVNFL